MKQLRKILLGIVLVGLAFLLIQKPIQASEGTFEIRSTTGKDYRCFAASVQMQDLKYKILITCRDLVYPADQNVFSYVVWVTPVKSGAPIKLGQLGMGRQEFLTNTPFTNLFITTEKDPNTNIASGPVVMISKIKPLTFLDRPTTPTPTIVCGQDNLQEEIKNATSSKNIALKDRASSAFKSAGIISLVALLGVIGLVFVVTRPK